jgi:hypothetical protein
MSDFAASLPDGATAESLRRLKLALILTRTCPRELGQEVALTGSAARGVADDASDLEVNFWVRTLPSADARADWLYSMGVRDYVLHFKPRDDQSVWVSGDLEGVPIEAGWQTFAALESCLTPIVAGMVFDRRLLTLAEIITSAVPLVPAPLLAEWQSQLRVYPAALRQRLVEDVLKLVTSDSHRDGQRRLAARGERLALAGLLRDDLRTMMRMLYAINGRWEAGEKWTLTLAESLPLMPHDWRARIDAVLSAPPVRAIDLCHALLTDAVALAEQAG